MAKTPRLTRELHSQIVAAIRAGGYSQVAAEAFGIPGDLLESWLERGRQAKKCEPYTAFAAAVLEAQAQARLRAETTAFQKDPKNWLAHGPGRELPGKLGWSTAVKAWDAAVEEKNVLLLPEVLGAFRALLDILAPYPEARLAAGELMWNWGLQQAVASKEKTHGRQKRGTAARKETRPPGPQSLAG